MKTDNEVLAEFMDGKFEKREIMTYGGLRHGKWTFDDDWWCFDDQLDYNTDWRRLMPVWYKFRDLKLELPLGQYKTYRDYWHRIANDIPRKDIAEVCKLLAKGIRWYNEIKKWNDYESKH